MKTHENFEAQKFAPLRYFYNRRSTSPGGVLVLPKTRQFWIFTRPRPPTSSSAEARTTLRQNSRHRQRCHYRPGHGNSGPSCLTIIASAKDSLWSVNLFRCESILLRTHGVMVVLELFTRRLVGFGVEAADANGVPVCRMFNHATAQQSTPKYLSTDHDPLETSPGHTAGWGFSPASDGGWQ